MTTDVLAHQGGWDEALLALAAVGVVVGAVLASRRRDAARHPGGHPSHCLYCGRQLPEGAVRCEGCGFKIEDD